MNEKLDTKEMTSLSFIRIRTIADLKRFNVVACEVPSNVTLISGTYRIDAKSLFGVLSLDLNKVITLEVSSKYESKFQEWA